MKFLAVIILGLISPMLMAKVHQKNTEVDQVSYSYGYLLAKEQQQKDTILVKNFNLKQVAKGFKDFLENKTVLTETQALENLGNFFSEEEDKRLKKEVDQASYSYGYILAKVHQKDFTVGKNINPKQVVKGFKDFLENKKALTETQMIENFNKFVSKVEEDERLKEVDQASYSYGYLFAKAQQNDIKLVFNLKQVAKGFEDFLENKTALTETQIIENLNNFFSKEEEAERLKEIDQASYSYGYLLAKDQQQQDTILVKNFNLKQVAKGFKDFVENKTALTETQIIENFNKFVSKVEEDERLKEVEDVRLKENLNEFFRLSAEQLKQGQEFLKQNAKKPDVISLKSGLQVQGLKNTQHLKSHAYKQVEILYEGQLIDGMIFDSSIARGEKKSFMMNQLIQGLQNGIQLMSVGDKARFFIPAHLAYGEIGSGVIPPSAVVIFDVELISAQ